MVEPDPSINPFTPGFGQSPPLLAGRAKVLDPIMQGFASASGTRHRFSEGLLIGARGTGKTVLLNAVEKEARRQNWVVVSEHAALDSNGKTVNQRLAEKFRVASESILAEATGVIRRRLRKLSVDSVSLGGLSIQVAQDRPDPSGGASLEEEMTRLAVLCSQADTQPEAVLFTIDELQNIALVDARSLGMAYQMIAHRNELPVAFVGAGLAEIKDSILDDPGATFLRRLPRWELGRLDHVDTLLALQGGFSAGKCEIDHDVLVSAAELAGGFPYQIQLIGWHAWELARAEASDHRPVVTHAHIDSAAASAHETFHKDIFDPIWRRLTPPEQRFLKSMAMSGDPCRTRDVIQLMDESPQYVNVYRRRLINKGIIVSPANGRLSFAHPSLAALASELNPPISTPPSGT